MLTKKLACPSCRVNLKVADTLPPGKVIKCPKCGKGFTMPEDNEEPAPPMMVTVKRRKAAPPPEAEQEPDDEPKVRRAPRKRRKRRKKEASNTPLIVGLVIVGAVLIVGVGVALLLIFRPSKNVPVAENNPAASGPSAPGPRAGRSGPAGSKSGPGRQEPVAAKPEAEPWPSGPAQVGGESDRSNVAQTVFEANCARCHSLGGETSSGGRRGGRGRGPDLSKVGARRSTAWLVEHIRNPASHNPNSKMPSFEGKISDDDLRSLAEYLAAQKG